MFGQIILVGVATLVTVVIAYFNVILFFIITYWNRISFAIGRCWHWFIRDTKQADQLVPVASTSSNEERSEKNERVCKFFCFGLDLVCLIVSQSINAHLADAYWNSQ